MYLLLRGTEEEGRVLERKWGGELREGGVPAFGQFQESRTMCLSTVSGAGRIQECPAS